ncbi:MAG: hypothetical protein ACLQVI_06030 [Polyangiaceae bacterium]|jgi:hypothetical protein
MRSFALLVLLAGLAAPLLGACASMQAAAANDPMKCERDPSCKNHQRSFDCSTQCADDSACVERCSEIQQQTGTSDPH